MLFKTMASGLALATAMSGAAVADDFELTILHINDLHSRIESINKYDSTCNAEGEAEGKCFGGIARVKSFIDMRRDELAAEGQNVLTLDAGDEFQGSMFYSTYKGKAAAEFMNAIGFDAMAVGNHEFDDGPSKLSEFIGAVDFPVVSGNTNVDNEPLLAGKIEPYVILETGGEKVAIVSVLAADTVETSSPGDNVTIGEEIGFLTAQVAELEEMGINKIIALTHVGDVKDMELAAKVPGLDIVIGGHSHTLFSSSDRNAPYSYPVWVSSESGSLVPVVSSYAYSKYVGELHTVWDDEGNIVDAWGDSHILDSSIKPDADMLARVKELGKPIEEMKTIVVGDTASEIVGARDVCRAQECEMGNMVSDAMLWATKDQGVQMVIQNAGGLRASIDAGEITMGEVLTVLPFQNTLATFKLNGEDVVKALENGFSKIEETAGRYPQVAGMKIVYDPSAPAGSRVISVEVADGNGGFSPIDDNVVYTIATNGYMRNGGDGYKIFKNDGMDAYDYGPGLEVVVADYLKSLDGPYTPYLDGRITAK